MEKSQRDIQLEQIRLCADIGIQCTDRNPEKRPVSTQEIIDRIQKMYCTDSSTETSLARSPALQVSLLPQPDTVKFLGAYVHLYFLYYYHCPEPVTFAGCSTGRNYFLHEASRCT
jgi:hypothetical protein